MLKEFQMDKLKVIIIYKIFNHYRKPIFDELNKNYNLTVLHSLNKYWFKSAATSYSNVVKTFKYGKNLT